MVREMSFGDGDLHKRVKELEAENKRLRQLVCDMYTFHSTDWRYTPLMRRMYEDMKAEMREMVDELKIEVD